MAMPASLSWVNLQEARENEYKRVSTILTELSLYRLAGRSCQTGTVMH
jgi:hypothetical protein